MALRSYLVFAAAPPDAARERGCAGVVADGVLRALGLRATIERFVRARALEDRVQSIGRPLAVGALEVVCAPEVAEELARLPEVHIVAPA